MYATLIFLHSFVRWFVLISLIWAIYKAYSGCRSKRRFSKTDNALRHWTATTAHIQLMIGIILYTQSPATKYFWNYSKAAIQNADVRFFSLIHLTLMIAAIVVITIGSAMTKRKTGDREKFKVMLVWFSIAIAIIIIAIPWPFSPFANRPYFRSL